MCAAYPLKICSMTSSALTLLWLDLWSSGFCLSQKFVQIILESLFLRTIVNVNGRVLKPLTPVSDQDRISPYYICTISYRKEMRIKKNIHFVITN